LAIIDKLPTQTVETAGGIAQESSADFVAPLVEGSNVEQENQNLYPLVAYVNERFMRSKDKRQTDETRWLRSYRNYRGEYDPSIQFNEDQSKVFVKLTKTKVLAAVAQIGDVLFAGNKFPLGIEATPVPEGDVPEEVSVDFSQTPPSQTATISRPELLGALGKKLEPVKDKVVAGNMATPTSATWEPVKMAAKKMEKKIHDQLEESDASKHLRQMAFEMALFGTGVVKGPFALDKEYPKWVKSEEGQTAKYEPVIKTIPRVAGVSIWNFYPDSDAHNMSECEWVVERHKLSRHDLRQLKKRPMFREESIELALSYGPNYQPQYWESILEDNSTTSSIERYEVLEYWGMMDRDLLEEQGLEIPDEFKDAKELQVNVWICNNQILRLVLNPYTPSYIPYYATPYEMNPYSFFGIGIAENMDDTQEIMNGVFRLTIDNLALSGNIILEVDENNLVPGQSMKLHPGKVFRRAGGPPGQAIFGTKFPNVTQELMAVFDKARQLTDESTNMPSYSHGGTGVQGMGRTASGMSMLMGAAAQSIKQIVRNIDDYFLSPLGKALFAFNMQFDKDQEIVGDLAVVARGTESLMRNEIRSQRLLQFMQTGLANPVTAPMIKADYILRELAASLDLDEEKVVNDAREMMLQAEVIKQMQAAMGNVMPAVGGQGVQDPTGTGGGTIAPGNAPEPGAAGFTGGGGGANGGGNPSATRAESASA
jgi:hypothetical protein